MENKQTIEAPSTLLSEWTKEQIFTAIELTLKPEIARLYRVHSLIQLPDGNFAVKLYLVPPAGAQN